jgi:uncharacterized protein
VTERVLRSTELDLRRVAAGDTPVTRSFALAQIDTRGDDYRVDAPVVLESRLSKAGERYRLTGHVRTTMELPCGRCLEPFAFELDAPFDLSYVPDPLAADVPEVELTEDDLSTAYYRDQILDLGEMIREQLQLALPMRPLCREDCRGLCPHCGANRNVQDCACEARWADPRLESLRDLLGRKD